MILVHTNHNNNTFPLHKINFVMNELPIKLESKTMKSVIKQTTFATSNIENRPILTGVNIKVENDKLTAIATDSFRLSQKVIDIPNNFENMNVLFVDLLDTLLRNTNPTLDANVAATLIDSIKSLQGQVNNIEDNITKNQGEIGNVFTLKFLDFKREYMADMQMILSSNTTDKLGPLIKEYNDSLLDKTRIMVSEIIPKNQETLHKNIDTSLQQLQRSITNDTTMLMNSSLTKDVLENYSSSIDEKFSSTLLSSQNLLNSLIESTEKRLDSRLSEIKDLSSTNNTSQVSLCDNINDLLKKMEKEETQIYLQLQ